jgi:LPXTG-motif cell wall-anchored protein
MKKTARTVTTLALAVLAALAMIAGPAAAQNAPYPPTGEFSITCTDTGPGETITCTITGAVAGESITVTITRPNGQVICTETVVADENGEATVTCEVPADARGRLNIRAEGEISGVATTSAQSIPPQARGEARGQQVAGVPGVPGGPGGGPTLPMTGSEVAVLLTVGLALIGGGLFALRRREDAKVRA